MGMMVMEILDIKFYEVKLEDNCIQNVHLMRYIVGYTVGNLVLRRRTSGTVKRDFQTINLPKVKLEYSYPNSNGPLQFCLNFAGLLKPHVIQRHVTL